jgi:hypothetical protein
MQAHAVACPHLFLQLARLVHRAIKSIDLEKALHPGCDSAPDAARAENQEALIVKAWAVHLAPRLPVTLAQVKSRKNEVAGKGGGFLVDNLACGLRGQPHLDPAGLRLGKG